MLLPDPVGVDRITFDPETTSMSASSCAGYRLRPWASTHPANASKRSSGSVLFGRWSMRGRGCCSVAGASWVVMPPSSRLTGLRVDAESGRPL
jgi:hypothetical protein